MQIVKHTWSSGSRFVAITMIFFQMHIHFSKMEIFRNAIIKSSTLCLSPIVNIWEKLFIHRRFTCIAFSVFVCNHKFSSFPSIRVGTDAVCTETERKHFQHLIFQSIIKFVCFKEIKSGYFRMKNTMLNVVDESGRKTAEEKACKT